MALLHVVVALAGLCAPALANQEPLKAPPGMRSPGQMKMVYGVFLAEFTELGPGSVTSM